jgi:hypothetical protein
MFPTLMTGTETLTVGKGRNALRTRTVSQARFLKGTSKLEPTLAFAHRRNLPSICPLKPPAKMTCIETNSRSRCEFAISFAATNFALTSAMVT